MVNFPPRQIGPVRSEVLVLGALDPELDVVLLRPDRNAALGSRIAAIYGPGSPPMTSLALGLPSIWMAQLPAFNPPISVVARPPAGTCSTCGASVRRRTWCGLPSPETTVSEIARNAGADTVGGLTEPLREIVNVAGTRALADPPAGLSTLVR